MNKCIEEYDDFDNIAAGGIRCLWFWGPRFQTDIHLIMYAYFSEYNKNKNTLAHKGVAIVDSWLPVFEIFWPI